MIGDRRVLIAAVTTGIRDVLHRRGAVAPFGMHLQVAQVLLDRGTPERGIREHAADFRTAEKMAPQLRLDGATPERAIREHAADFRTAEKMAPQLPAPLNICAAVTLVDGLF